MSRSLALALDHHVLDVRNSLGWVQTLGANLRAVHNGVATIELERVFKVIEAFASAFVAAVDQPAIGLQERGRPEIFVTIPPI